ncbi:MAG: DUF742 domain-containing protein [Acidimicrobiales bacterium]|nr:DUF742 domain-containing protein [Acidimicrobiales bacterium]
MTSPDEPRVVPVYAITRGRTRSVGRDLPLETLVKATANATATLPRLKFEAARIVSLCQSPISIAEVASHLGVPLGVARVLVSDLHADGMLTVSLPALNDGGRPRVDILERLLSGLKAQT